MSMAKVPLIDNHGNTINEIELPKDVFGPRPNITTIYQAVTCYMANQRKGLADTKTRGEVSGGGKKPWRQKGTGRARVGSTRSPLWRHGGVVFGPHPRDFSFSVPKKIRVLALKSAFLAKADEGNLFVVESLPNFDKASTKEAARWLSVLKLREKKHNQTEILLLLDNMEKKGSLSLRNIAGLHLNTVWSTNSWEVLGHKKVVVVKDAFEKLIARFKK